MKTEKSEPTPVAVEMRGNLTLGEYNALTAKHGKLMPIKVEADEADGLPEQWFWFRKPTMPEMAAMTKFVDSDPLQSGQIMFRSCLVKGDVTAVDDVDLFTSISPLLSGLIKKRVAKIQNF